MKYDCIVWDWNGTLFNDVNIGIDVVNGMLKSKGLREISRREEYHRVFCFPIKDYYKNIGFDFERDSFESLANIYIESYREKSRKAKLFDGAKETLEAINKLGVKQIVLSASEKSILLSQMEPFKIESYLDDVLGINDNYAESKVHLAKSWMDSHAIDPKKILFIGDTLHDFQVAGELSCNCLLISAGHHSKEQLELTGAPVVDSIKDVYQFIS